MKIEHLMNNKRLAMNKNKHWFIEHWKLRVVSW
jgi:hypothetical protein